MKVKILECPDKDLWYHTMVGEIIEVEDSNFQGIYSHIDTGMLIMSRCEIIKDTVKVMITGARRNSWYWDAVGETFDTVPIYTRDTFEVVRGYEIDAMDCRIIKDEEDLGQEIHTSHNKMLQADLIGTGEQGKYGKKYLQVLAKTTEESLERIEQKQEAYKLRCDELNNANAVVKKNEL